MKGFSGLIKEDCEERNILRIVLQDCEGGTTERQKSVSLYILLNNCEVRSLTELT